MSVYRSPPKSGNSAGASAGAGVRGGDCEMGNALHKLSARRVATEVNPGRHSDGGGLYLVVSETGSRKWLFIFRREGKQREMGLGPAAGPTAVSLSDARTRAAECRSLLVAGLDPIVIRRERKSMAAEVQTTFGEFADRYIAAHRSSWRNAKHGSCPGWWCNSRVAKRLASAPSTAL